MLHPSVKRLLGAVLLMATVGASSILATRSSGASLLMTDSHSRITLSHHG